MPRIVDDVLANPGIARQIDRMQGPTPDISICSICGTLGIPASDLIRAGDRSICFQCIALCADIVNADSGPQRVTVNCRLRNSGQMAAAYLLAPLAEQLRAPPFLATAEIEIEGSTVRLNVVTARDAAGAIAEHLKGYALLVGGNIAPRGFFKNREREQNWNGYIESSARELVRVEALRLGDSYASSLPSAMLHSDLRSSVAQALLAAVPGAAVSRGRSRP